MQPGLVSVVMPAYRADRFLPRALESVEFQRYGLWELILVEDGSCGETERQIADFKATVSTHRVVYRRQEDNRGPSACRNTAIELAEGEFLAFLDADDAWTETHLEASVGVLNQSGADIAFSTALMFEDGTDHLLGLWGPTPENLATTPPDLRTFPGWLFHRCFILPSATVMRRHIVDKVGPFNDAHRAAEDLEYWLRAVRAGIQFVHVPGLHCLYRKANPLAATGQLAGVLSRQASVLEDHLDFPGLPRRVTRRQAAYFHTAAAVFHVDRDPRTAARHLQRAWCIHPARIDLLLLSAWTRWAVPLLPDLGIARKIRRSRGYE